MTPDAFFSWQVYAALGLTLIIIEAFVTTFFLFPLGISLLIIALVAPYLNLEIELIAFAILSVINFFVSVKFVKPHFTAKKQLTGIDSLVGREFRVHEDINELENTGSVKVYADEWRALPSVQGQTIAKNELVRIDRFSGNKVYVSKI